MLVFGGVLFIFGCRSGRESFVVFFEKKFVLADCWVRIVFLIEDVSKLVVSELTLAKWDELVSLPLVSVERGSSEVEFEQRFSFL